MNVLIMGPAGSGKGTIAERIIDDYKVFHLSTGNMLREAIQNNEPSGLEAKSYMDAGKLVPDSIVNKIVEDSLKQKDLTHGFLTDGYPRTLAQAIDFDDLLNRIDQKIDLVISLEINFDHLVSRITGRRLCKKCGSIYHIISQPSKVEGVCDKCGSDLYQRSDDTAEQLKIRLDEHSNNTEPLLAHYEKMNLLYRVDADGGREEVYQRVVDILEKFK